MSVLSLSKKLIRLWALLEHSHPHLVTDQEIRDHTSLPPLTAIRRLRHVVGIHRIARVTNTGFVWVKNHIGEVG